MRDVALLKLNNAYANREADNGWRQLRGPGAQLATLAMGYELTHDQKYLTRMEGMRDRAYNLLKQSGAKAFAHASGQFMYGIGIEGLIYLHLITGDEKTLEVIKGLTDYLIEGQFVPGASTTNIAFGLAYLYHQTGEMQYRDWAVRTLGYQRAKTTGELKSFGQSYRASGRAFYYIQAQPLKE